MARLAACLLVVMLAGCGLASGAANVAGGVAGVAIGTAQIGVGVVQAVVP